MQVDLPVNEIIPEVLTKLEANNTLILQAPPGAGKSTLVPLALLDSPFLEGKKIYMLEPRRLAARSIASRMASLLGEEVGETVGYRIRFENRTSEKTKIEVLTEGILTRMLHSDNALEDVGIVIFDEFHERNIHADVAMALCRESQQVLRQDLRIMVMSATLEMDRLAQMLNAPVLLSDGRQYPVEVKFTEDADPYLLPDLTASLVVKASKENDGDILVFLPGQGEILKCEQILRRELKGTEIHPLYGQLPHAKQHRAIMPNKNGKRKVVLATSIAETSLTIEGIKVVIDCGFGRTGKFDPRSGLSRLETIRISKDSADQRAGRAGRLGPGICYRMWTKATHQRLKDHRVPEIEEADLAPLVLDMASWGIEDANELLWLTPPPSGSLSQAREILEELEAIEDGQITEHGKAVHALPCHPRIAHMMLMAQEEDLADLASDIAAVLEERDPLPKEAGIDINLRIEALRKFREGQSSIGRLKRIEKVAESYRRLFDIEPDNGEVDFYETGLMLTYAYPERIACARPGNNAQFQLSNGRLAQAFHKDDLAHEAWLAVANLDAREGMGRIFLASPLNPRDLQALVKQQEVIEWDTEDGGLQARLEMRVGNIVLKSTPLPDPDPSNLEQAVLDAIKKEGGELLNFDEDVEQWQNRVSSLRVWRPFEKWPEVSSEHLLNHCEKWLKPYLSEVKSPRDLKKINLKEVLHFSLPHELQGKLDELAPEKISVPSGSKVKIEYKPKGNPPVLAVRLQEMFGLLNTPTVNEGKVSLLLHLLSPGFKPVQVTSDLESFWKNAYFEVRKELKRRYPKHHWPDDPMNEEAVRGVKRKKD
jgi:ATP-dependent helicase HrpB